ncbi:hypothetical protein HDV05_008101 [Chytridiales sp. JEL 0842]|nr:hypothetical protein HDV05_008101 [Chytridiales sp. JEL 0842]
MEEERRRRQCTEGAEEKKGEVEVTIEENGNEAAAVSAFRQLHTKNLGGTTRQLLLAYARFNPFESTQIPLLSTPSEIQSHIPGLILIPSFLTPTEEQELINSIEREDKPWENLSTRQVKHYGFQFDYTLNKSTLSTSPLPPFLSPLLARLRETLPDWNPDQLTINRYPPASGISPHVDTHTAFRGPIVSVSLLSDVSMEFRRRLFGDDGKMKKYEAFEVRVGKGSCLVMSGDARFGWEHGIRARGADVVEGRGVGRGWRVSLTLREVVDWEEGVEVGERCRCEFPWVCDARIPGGAIPDRLKQESDRVSPQFVFTKYNLQPLPAATSVFPRIDTIYPARTQSPPICLHSVVPGVDCPPPLAFVDVDDFKEGNKSNPPPPALNDAAAAVVVVVVVVAVVIIGELDFGGEEEEGAA